MEIERIKWHDSNFRSGWDRVDGIEPLAIGDAVGFVKGENDKVVTLVMSLGDNGCTLGALTIAKTSIIERKKMRVK
jgi:hypothetical protein